MRRRLLVTALAYGAAAGITWLVPDVRPLDAPIDPLSLLWLGFLILAAWSAGDVCAIAGVPRLTGYLLTGVVLGPHGFDLVGRRTVGSLLSFGTGEPVMPLGVLVLGFMMLHVGAALAPRLRRADLAPLGRLVLTQTGLVLLLGATAAAGVFLLPGLGADAMPLSATLAAAALLVGGSPATTSTVLDATGSHGPIGGLLLASAAAREALAPILLALALAISGAGGSTLLSALAGLAAAAAGGWLTALVLLGVRRSLRRDSALVTLVVVLLVGVAAARITPYGPPLLFLVTGLVLSRSGDGGHAILRGTAVFASPVTVLFFACAGVTLPVVAPTAAVAGGLMLAVVRAVALTLAGSLSGPRARPAAAGALPHLGVTVGLAVLLGQTEGFGPAVRDVILASVLISEVLGATVLRAVLARAGETAHPEAADEAPVPLTPLEQVLDAGPELPAAPSDLGPALVRPLERLRLALQERMDHFADTLGEALRAGPFGYLRDLPPHSGSRREETIAQWIAPSMAFSGQAATLEILHRAIDALNADIEGLVMALRPVSLPESPPDLARRPGDGVLARALKARRRGALRLGARRHAQRVVRLDLLARYHLVAPLPGRLVTIANLALRAPALALDEVRRRLTEPDLEPSDAALGNLIQLGDDALARAMLLFADALESLYDAAAVAGTPSLPERAYQPSRRFAESREGRRTLDLTEKRWAELVRGLGGALVARLHTDAAVPTVLMTFEQAGTAVSARLDEVLAAPLRALRSTLGEASEAVLRAMGTTAAPDLPELLRGTRAELTTAQEAAARQLGERLERTALEAPLTDLRAGLEALAHSLPDRLEVRANPGPLPEEGRLPTAREAATAPLAVREVAHLALVDDSALELVGAAERLAGMVEAARGAIVQAGQVLRFHLDAAAGEVESAEASDPLRLAREFVAGGLHRASELLGDAVDANAAGGTALGEAIHAAGRQACERLRTYLVDAPPARAEIYRAERRSRTAELEEAAEAETRTPPLRQRVRARLDPALSLLGLGRPAVIDTDPSYPFRMAARATLAHTRTLGLPETYLRLFGFGPVAIDDFFVARRAETASLQRAIRRWRRALPAAVLVSGPPGSGRTSLVDRTLRRLPPGTVVARVPLVRRLVSERALVKAIAAAAGLEAAQTSHRLSEALVSRPEPMVVVLDGLPRVHVRYREGLAAVHSLIELMGRTAEHVLWIACADPVALQAMNGLLPISAAFTHHVVLEPLDADAVARMVEARHRASGYRLRFQRANAGQEPGDARGRCFADLAARSGGVPLLALWLWLRSVRIDTDGKEMTAETPGHLDLGFVDSLPLEDLLVLAQVHVHDGLTAAELARALHRPAAEVREQLRRLAWRHLVHVTSAEVHELNPVLWPEIRAALARRGIV